MMTWQWLIQSADLHLADSDKKINQNWINKIFQFWNIVPYDGNNSGKTAGKCQPCIVIGLLFAICAVLDFAYYGNQNDIPLVAQQQSFGSLNSSNNDDGVTDGVAYLLDNLSVGGNEDEQIESDN